MEYDAFHSLLFNFQDVYKKVQGSADDLEGKLAFFSSCFSKWYCDFDS